MGELHTMTYVEAGTCSHGCHTYWALECSCGWRAQADRRHDGGDRRKVLEHMTDVLAEKLGLSFELPEGITGC